MALLLGLDVSSCDISRSPGRNGELGNCIVIAPDPVGVKRYLVAMGGIMAEHRFFQSDHGGRKDRHDATEHLFRYLSHYRDPRRDELQPLFTRVADLFYRRATLSVLERVAGELEKKGRLQGDALGDYREALDGLPDVERLRGQVESLGEPPRNRTLAETAWDLLVGAYRTVMKARKM